MSQETPLAKPGFRNRETIPNLVPTCLDLDLDLDLELELEVAVDLSLPGDESIVQPNS